MKIKCDVCEKLEAEVLCCADEAVLCKGCDVKVHAANKLSQKHQRVSLLKDIPSSSSLPSSSSSSNSMLPFCDICQATKAYFFCLEDRALLCRQCDVTKHSASPFVSSHQRYLIAGIKVALEPYNCNAASTSSISATQYNTTKDVDMAAEDTTVATMESAPTLMTSEYSLTNKTEWTFEEILGASELEYHGYCDVDSTKMGSQ